MITPPTCVARWSKASSPRAPSSAGRCARRSRACPRHLFVPNVDLDAAYKDQPVFIRWVEGIPISSSTQPTMMAIMAEQLRLEPGCRVLEIGAGTGYNAAILAHVVGPTGSVITVDIEQDIVDEAASNLSNGGYENVEGRVWGTATQDTSRGSPTTASWLPSAPRMSRPTGWNRCETVGSWWRRSGSGVTGSAWPCKSGTACSKACPRRRACSSRSAAAPAEPRDISPSAILPTTAPKCTWAWNRTIPTTAIC